MMLLRITKSLSIASPDMSYMMCYKTIAGNFGRKFWQYCLYSSKSQSYTNMGQLVLACFQRSTMARTTCLPGECFVSNVRCQIDCFSVKLLSLTLKPCSKLLAFGRRKVADAHSSCWECDKANIDLDWLLDIPSCVFQTRFRERETFPSRYSMKNLICWPRKARAAGLFGFQPRPARQVMLTAVGKCLNSNSRFAS